MAIEGSRELLLPGSGRRHCFSLATHPGNLPTKGPLFMRFNIHSGGGIVVGISQDEGYWTWRSTRRGLQCDWGATSFKSLNATLAHAARRFFLAVVSTGQPVRISGYLDGCNGPIDASVSRHLIQHTTLSREIPTVWASHLWMKPLCKINLILASQPASSSGVELGSSEGLELT